MGVVGIGRPARPAPPPRARGPKEDELMDIAWFLVVSAMVFSIGAGGVLTRRNPLVVLLCLELMLNAANLALLAFSRMWGNGDGQIFAIVVIVVAACEVCIGLGVVVAMFRRRLPVDVDELTELSG
jgi:NADH:ubiquinone oxidoreductase subunit K